MIQMRKYRNASYRTSCYLGMQAMTNNLIGKNSDYTIPSPPTAMEAVGVIVRRTITSHNPPLEPALTSTNEEKPRRLSSIILHYLK